MLPGLCRHFAGTGGVYMLPVFSQSARETLMRPSEHVELRAQKMLPVLSQAPRDARVPFL
eukprot:COSAG01_NODE_66076_length_271_cov_0.825581_1_plen_59_part_01